jgi:excisionase family DNA binding protein
MRDNDLVTTAEFADMVRAPLESVRYWVHIGKAPRSVKIGRRRLFRRSDVLAWIDKQYAATK